MGRSSFTRASSNPPSTNGSSTAAKTQGHSSTASGSHGGAVSDSSAETRSSSARATATGSEITSDRSSFEQDEQPDCSGHIGEHRELEPALTHRGVVALGARQSRAPASPAVLRQRRAPPTLRRQAVPTRTSTRCPRTTGTRRPTTHSPSIARAAEPMLSTERRSPVARSSHTMVCESREISRNPDMRRSDPLPDPIRTRHQIGRRRPEEGRQPAELVEGQLPEDPVSVDDLRACVGSGRSPTARPRHHEQRRPPRAPAASAGLPPHPIAARPGPGSTANGPREEATVPAVPAEPTASHAHVARTACRPGRADADRAPRARPWHHRDVPQHQREPSARRTASAPRGPMVSARSLMTWGDDASCVCATSAWPHSTHEHRAAPARPADLWKQA